MATTRAALREAYDTMVGHWWLYLYAAIAATLAIIAWLLPVLVKSYAGVYMFLLFFGPPVLPYLLIPPFRLWKAFRRC